MGKILLDADAIPRSVKALTAELAGDFGWEMVTVASFKHNIEGEHRHITVGAEPQAADLALLNNTRKGDIVITQDWGLAALVLAKGAQALSPWGRVYREEKMDFLLEERHLKAKVRRSGGRTRGPAPRRPEDDLRFKNALEKLLSSCSPG
jgi:uncharacterized protein YaiI (UPF0178 family)